MITTSGGGALICPTPEAAQKTLFYATQARDDAPYYQHSEIGYNYRMSNISAGIGRGQMYALDSHIARRRRIHDLYCELLADAPGITVHCEPDENFNSNYWLTCITVDASLAGKSHRDIYSSLNDANVESRPLWKPLHLQPVFADCPFYGDGTAEKIFRTGLCLPSGPLLTDEDVYKVVELIKG